MKKSRLFTILLSLLSLSFSACSLEPEVKWEKNNDFHWKVINGNTTDYGTHEFGDWVSIQEATETNEGYRSRTCSVCQYVQIETVPVIHHHTFSSKWSSDENSHWHEATCGHDVVSEKGTHTFGSYEVVKEPTETTTGIKQRTCSICSYIDSESIPMTGFPDLITGKTLMDVFNDTDGNYKNLYEITGVIAAWRINKTDATIYGNFYLSEDDTSTLRYNVYGATATATALSYDSALKVYGFNNPADFLSNDTTKDIKIGDTVKMWVTRNDYDTYQQICGVIVSVTPKHVTPTEGSFVIDIYASNDVHGQIEEDGSSFDIATYGSFMKQKGMQKNTLLLDQGDSWQGSIYSNHNHGKLVNDVMCEAEINARTVGNHDFDWGIKYVKENTARSYNGYNIPVLAANVYDYNYSTKTEGNIQQSDIGRKTVSYILDNGLKVGIVGVIGRDQITSITSNYVRDICFKEHIAVIKEEAKNLRNDGCDLVIACVHAGQKDVYGNSLENYVDLVLCGHTHVNEKYSENGLYYAQFGHNNEYIGHVQLTYDASLKKVTKTVVDSLDKYVIKSEIDGIDPDVLSIVNSYKKECDAEAKVVVASNTTYFSQKEHSVNLMCEAVLDEVKKEGYNDVILSYCNSARAYLKAGQWTYGDIYTAFPFDNTIQIASVKGSDILYEVKNYNNVCYADSFNKRINPNSYYQIACLDYLLYHNNVNRNYDYFPSFIDASQLTKNYREILRDYLINNGYNTGKSLSSSDYSSNLDKFNGQLLTSI